MSHFYFIASHRPIQEFHQDGKNFPFISGEHYKGILPFSLPYVYEIGREIGDDNMELITFLDRIMEIGDVVEVYIYEEGKHGRMLSFNYPEEGRTVNLHKKTYKDRHGEFQFSKKRWKEELARRTIASKRSVTNFNRV